MNIEERKQRAKWIDATSDAILQEMGAIYKHHTRHLSDTDVNLIYHGLLVENIFYKMYVSILESVSDDARDHQMNEMIMNLRIYRRCARNNEEMLKLMQERSA